MKKRQIKKNAKVHVRVFADEGNLLMMSAEERESAIQDYIQYRQMLAKKRYRELKNLNPMYVFPIGKKGQEFINTVGKRLRSTGSFTITQSINDLKTI